MSDVRIYVDEDAEEHAVVEGLRNRGIDVLTATDAQLGGATDPEQLAHAVREGRVLYSLNVGDFARIHRDCLTQGVDHFGIIAIPGQRYSIGEKIRRIASLVTTMTADAMKNRMEYL